MNSIIKNIELLGHYLQQDRIADFLALVEPVLIEMEELKKQKLNEQNHSLMRALSIELNSFIQIMEQKQQALGISLQDMQTPHRAMIGYGNY